ncbi:MAG: efflux transporter outer membrane subunit [Magnetococcales bacterium]|nr:efflux transporter outer membrane subunit [Magnetococcales bacterium]
MTRSFFSTIAAALLLGGSITGCAPQPSAPLTAPLDLPNQWRRDLGTTEDRAMQPDSWWQALGSPTLNRLQESARAHHPDIQAVTARLAQAQARLNMAASPLWPALELDASHQRAQRSGTTSKGSIVQTSQVALRASYELDYRGRNQALTDKASSELESSRLEQEIVTWSLTSELASAYVRLLTLKARRTTLQHSRMTADRILEITTHKVSVGHLSPLDEIRQKNNVTAIAAQQANLEMLHDQAEHALALLSTQPLTRIQEITDALDQLHIPAIAPGVPATLLTRRPDIRQAEADLAAARADLRAARAALFPTIQLTAQRGYASSDLSTLLSPTALFWNLSSSLVASLFDHGKTQGATELAEAKQQAAVAAYQKTIRAALKDVEDNLSALHWLADQERAQQTSLATARESLRLVEARHQAGANDFISVLEAQRTLLQIQDELPQLRQARLNAAIGLFKALGGQI